MYSSTNSILRKNLVPWDMAQNTLGQSDCKVFNYICRKSLIFCMLMQIYRNIKSWLENMGICMVKSRYGHVGLRTLRSSVSQEWIDEVSWFFPCWYKFRKAKSYVNSYWMGTVKNGWGLIDHGILKSGLRIGRIEQIDLTDFTCW